MNMKLEVVMLPVADVDRAKDFYKTLGFREDIDLKSEERRIAQFTPPGSDASIFIGTGMVNAAPGSAQGMVLVVDDIEAAHQELKDKGIKVTEIFHDPDGLFYHVHNTIKNPGIHPDRQSYFSYIAFNDPDGNGWIIQEVTNRLPGRVDKKGGLQ